MATAKKSSAKKAPAKKSTRSAAKKSATPTAKKWSAKVDTDSTHPDQGLFLKSATQIAKALATHKVSPKGLHSGMQMLTFYMNRAGKNLPAERLKTLNHAKELLSKKIAKEDGNGEAAAKKAPAKKTSKR